MFKYGRIPLKSYIEPLAKTVSVDNAYRTINLCLTAGGIAGVYQAGVTGYLLALYNDKKIFFNRIYGSSAGAFAGAFFLFMIMRYENNLPTYDIDDFMNMFHVKLPEEAKKENHYLALAWKNILIDIFPEDIHLYCNGKLTIAINVIDNFRIVHKEISYFKSKEHLIDVITTSMSIPFLTIPSLFARYNCPFTNKSYLAFDGVFTPKINPENESIYPVLVVDLHQHPYPLTKRLHLLEKSYDFLAIEGIQDTHLLFTEQREISSLYFDKTGSTNKVMKFTFFHFLFFCFFIIKTRFI